MYFRSILYVLAAPALMVLAAGPGALPGFAAEAAPAPAVKVPAKQTVVLLYDGKLPDQVKLEETIRTALQEHTGKIDLQSMHAGRAETVPLLKKFNLTRANAPLLLILDEPGPHARILKKVPLDAGEDGKKMVRSVLSALKLPLPAAEPPKPGPIAAFNTDGGEAEKGFLQEMGGSQRLKDGVRVFDPTGFASYRFAIPEALRKADLRIEGSGAFAIEWADSAKGAWSTLLDTSAYLGGGEDKVKERLQPAVDLSLILTKLPGSLFVRFRPNGRGRAPAQLARLELVALAPTEDSATTKWATQVETLRKQYGIGVPNDAHGTLVGGVLTKDTVLMADQSPYTLTADLVVPWGKRLTVEPGVTVKAAGHYVIRVNGDLIAKGTASKPIVFTSTTPEGPDDWRGIEFSANHGFFSGARSALEFCRIANAAALILPRFDGDISSCVFENSLRGVTLKDGGKGRLRHNRFLRCYQGLTVAGGAGEVTDNEWSECLVGITVMELSPTQPFKFEGNSVTGSRQAAINYFKQPNRKVKTLSLPNNHWGDAAPEKLIGGGAEPADVTLEPRLSAAPAGVGPQDRL
jgi:hypothetical protein